MESVRCNKILKHKIHIHCTSFMVYGLPSTVNISSATQDTKMSYAFMVWCLIMHRSQFTLPVQFIMILDLGKYDIPNLYITYITNAYPKKQKSNRFLHYSSGFPRHYLPNLWQNRIKQPAVINSNTILI